jgi:Zinc finger, C3HC4 type (RING finger)
MTNKHPRTPQNFSRKLSISNGNIPWHVDFALAQQSGQWQHVRANLAQATQHLNNAGSSNNSCASSCSSDSDQAPSPQQPNISPMSTVSKNGVGKRAKPKGTSFWNRISLSRGNNSSGNVNSNRDRSGFLVQDAEQKTPLHVILSSRRSPPDLVLQVLYAEPRAASMPNNRGRLPLHFAVVHRQDFSVIAALIDVFPAAISFPDSKGRSPLQYAVDIAKRESQSKSAGPAPRTYWMPLPDDCEEAMWQEDQSDRWAVVHWLLLSSATHPQTSLSVGGRKPLLVEALLCAASPAVISLLVGASVTLLSYENKATAFAGSTLYTCITRHYPLTILMSLANQCHPDVHKVRDETGMGLVSAQFISGCFEQLSSTKEWTVSEDFYACLMECIQEREIGDDPAMSDWWRKIEFLIAFCSCPTMNRRVLQNRRLQKYDPNNFPTEFLLHAALLNIDTPPTVVRALLAIYPKSIKLADPCTGPLPLHMAAMNRDYVPRNYEVHTIGHETVLDIILEADRTAIHKRHEGRLALHYAVASGRMIDTLNPLLAAATTSTASNQHDEHEYPQLLDRDPVTGLFPFMLAASYPNKSDMDSFRWTCVARNKYSNAVWQGLSDRQKASAVLKVAESEEIARVDTIFELLRRQPAAISGTSNQLDRRPVLSNSSRRIGKDNGAILQTRDSTGKGVVAAHYISWCFREVEDRFRGVTWSPNVLHRDLLVQAKRCGSIAGGFSLLPADFNAWWTQLIIYIQRTCRQQLGHFDAMSIPAEQDDFVLHAALSNSDTPPEIIELLVARDAKAASRCVPGSSVLPLHIAAGALCYTPRSFEKYPHSALELTLSAFPIAARVMSKGRLPLHIAIVSSKPFCDIEALVVAEPRALQVKDPVTGLYPCLLMASRKEYTSDQRSRFQYLARNRFDEKAWCDLTPQARTKQVQLVQREHAMDVLSSIFLLVRRDASQIQRSRESYEDASESQSATTGYLTRSHSLLSPSLITRNSDASAATDDSFLAQAKKTVSPADRAQNPSSLMLLLSQHRAKPSSNKDDLFDCDASVLSNMDMMSTLSSTMHTLQTTKTMSKARKTGQVECVDEESINLSSFCGGSEDETSYDDFAEDSDVPSSSTRVYIDDNDSTVVVDATENDEDAEPSVQTEEYVEFEIPRVPRFTSGRMRDGDHARASIKLIKKPPPALLAEIKAHSLSNRESNESQSLETLTTSGSIDRNSAKSKFSYTSLRSDEKARIHKSAEMLWMSPDLFNANAKRADNSHYSDVEQSSVSLSLPSTHQHFEAVSAPSSQFAVHSVLQNGARETSTRKVKKMESFSPLSSPSSSSRVSSRRSESSNVPTQSKRQATVSAGSGKMLSASQPSLLGSYGDTDMFEDDPLLSLEREPARLNSLRSFSDHNTVQTKKPVASNKADAILKRSSSDIAAQTQFSSLLSGNDESSSANDDILLEETPKNHRRQIPGSARTPSQKVDDVPPLAEAASAVSHSLIQPSSNVQDASLAQSRETPEVTVTNPVARENASAAQSRAKLFNKRTMSWEDQPKTEEEAKDVDPSKSNGRKPVVSFDKQTMRWVVCGLGEQTQAEVDRKTTENVEARTQRKSATPFDDLLQSRTAHFSKSERHQSVVNNGRSWFRGGSLAVKAPRQKSTRQTTIFNASQSLLLCLLCNENGREVLMVPCQHLCLCSSCSGQRVSIERCPLCSGRVTGRTKM